MYSLYYYYKCFEHARRYRKWVRQGKPMPGPHFVKQIIIKEYERSHKMRVFVETGTFKGDMVRAMKGVFKELYTIELHEGLHQKAKEKFAGDHHVHCLHGDSSSELPKLVERLKEPVLFWLDGHYSGEKTAKGAIDTPIMQELTTLFAHPIKSHVILIDDARLFVGENDYPTVADLEAYCKKERPDLRFSVADDVIRLVPEA